MTSSSTIPSKMLTPNSLKFINLLILLNMERIISQHVNYKLHFLQNFFSTPKNIIKKEIEALR